MIKFTTWGVIALTTYLLMSRDLMAEAVTELSAITVTTATKTAKKIEGVTASVEVINAKEIKKMGAITLKDVISKIPSLTSQYGRFPHPSSQSKAAISIRGTGANGTLILIDGKRLSGETENPYEMSRISTAMIDRIEIVKGSMSTLYGSDAIGGVINIITKKATKTVSHIDVKYGQNSEGDAKEKSFHASTLGKKAWGSYKLFGSIIKTSPFIIDKHYRQQAVHPQTHQNVPNAINGQGGTIGVTYRDDAEVKTFGAGFGFDISAQTALGIDLNFINEDREGNYLGLSKKPTSPVTAVIVKNTPVHSVDDNSRKDIAFDIKHTMANDTVVKARAYRSDYKKRNRTTALNFKAPVNTKFSANVIIDGLEVSSSSFIGDKHLLTLGAEHRKEVRHSSAINPNPSSSEFITKEVRYRSLYAQDEIEINKSLNTTIGLRYDSISNADSKTTAKVGVVKRLANGVILRANAAQGYRVPDVAELYVVSPFFKDARRFGAEVIFGPKTTAYKLKPESSQTMELAIGKRTEHFQGELVLFQNDIKDKIALVTKRAGTPGKYYTSENLKDVNIKGLELSSKWRLSNKLDLGFNSTLLDTENKATNKELAYTPNISTATSLNYQVTPKLATSLNIRHTGSQYVDELNTRKAEGYSTLDLSLAYQVNKQVEVYGGINNLTDTAIDETLGTTVGRFIYTGLRTNF